MPIDRDCRALSDAEKIVDSYIRPLQVLDLLLRFKIKRPILSSSYIKRFSVECRKKMLK